MKEMKEQLVEIVEICEYDDDGLSTEDLLDLLIAFG